MSKPTETDLEQLDQITDEMIDTSEIALLAEDFFATAKWRIPKHIKENNPSRWWKNAFREDKQPTAA